MMYSTSKRFAANFAEQHAGVVIAKSLEASELEEISAEVLEGEFKVEEKGETNGFARPKRPGRR